ncbi:hypothetical protein BASA81_002244 [Batrachochytrium salamandrivorans]|nr:hypothetical protein BASA81_002244 [Batrachochytrium salamandrivorans]
MLCHQLSPSDSTGGGNNLALVCLELDNLAKFASELFSALERDMQATTNRLDAVHKRTEELGRDKLKRSLCAMRTESSHPHSEKPFKFSQTQQSASIASIFAKPHGMQKAREEVKDTIPDFSAFPDSNAVSKRYSNPKFFVEVWLKTEEAKLDLEERNLKLEKEQKKRRRQQESTQKPAPPPPLVSETARTIKPLPPLPPSSLPAPPRPKRPESVRVDAAAPVRPSRPRTVALSTTTVTTAMTPTAAVQPPVKLAPPPPPPIAPTTIRSRPPPPPGPVAVVAAVQRTAPPPPPFSIATTTTQPPPVSQPAFVVSPPQPSPAYQPAISTYQPAPQPPPAAVAVVAAAVVFVAEPPSPILSSPSPPFQPMNQSPPPSSPPQQPGGEVADDLKKFAQMQKMNMPRGAIEQAMIRAQIDPTRFYPDYVATPSIKLPITSQAPPRASAPPTAPSNNIMSELLAKGSGGLKRAEQREQPAVSTPAPGSDLMQAILKGAGQLKHVEHVSKPAKPVIPDGSDVASVLARRIAIIGENGSDSDSDAGSGWDEDEDDN